MVGKVIEIEGARMRVRDEIASGTYYVKIRESTKRKQQVGMESIDTKSATITSYLHKEHKFQLQAYIMRVMKKE